MSPVVPAVIDAVEAFGGEHVGDNFARLFIIFAGITLALVSLKIGYLAARRRQVDRALGCAAFACIVVTPSISGVLRFGQPIQYETYVTYALGLLLGIAALAFRVSVAPPWWHRPRFRRRPPGKD